MGSVQQAPVESCGVRSPEGPGVVSSGYLFLFFCIDGFKKRHPNEIYEAGLKQRSCLANKTHVCYIKNMMMKGWMTALYP